MAPWLQWCVIGAISVVAGVLGAWSTGIVHLTMKRWRNAVLVRRGEPPIRDVLFQPMTVPGAVLGLVVGAALGWWLEWWTVLAAGLAFPALWLPLALVAILSSLRREG